MMDGFKERYKDQDMCGLTGGGTSNVFVPGIINEEQPVQGSLYL
jgi:hypothetical protein